MDGKCGTGSDFCGKDVSDILGVKLFLAPQSSSLSHHLRHCPTLKAVPNMAITDYPIIRYASLGTVKKHQGFLSLLLLPGWQVIQLMALVEEIITTLVMLFLGSVAIKTGFAGRLCGIVERDGKSHAYLLSSTDLSHVYYDGTQS